MNDNEWKIAVDGAAVSAMPEEDRWAKIIEPAPDYLQDPQAEGNAERHKIKLIVNGMVVQILAVPKDLIILILQQNSLWIME